MLDAAFKKKKRFMKKCIETETSNVAAGILLRMEHFKSVSYIELGVGEFVAPVNKSTT